MCIGARRGRPLKSHPPPASAFTLPELLVALGIFLVLGLLLVMLLSAGLGMWHKGEVRRDLDERARVVLDPLVADLSCAYVETGWEEIPSHGAGAGGAPAPRGVFTISPDGRNQSCLRFSRAVKTWRGDAVPAAAPAAVPPKPGAQPVFSGADLRASAFPVRYVAYLLDPVDSRLWRWEDEGASAPAAFASPAALAQPKVLQGRGAPLADGVLAFRVRCWTPDTTVWDEIPIVVGGGPSGKSGPSLRWDHTRRLDRDFWLWTQGAVGSRFRTGFVVPRKIQILLVLEPSRPAGQSFKLRDALSAKDKTLTVASGRDMPEGPGYVRVDDEWIAFDARKAETLTLSARGLWGSRAATHAAGAEVRAGAAVVTTLAVPAGRDP